MAEEEQPTPKQQTPQPEPPETEGSDVDMSQTADADDAEKNKVFAVLSYFGILFIVPLLAAKESRFAMYHANQGLLLFLTGVAVQIVGIITAPILIGFLVLVLGWLFVFVLFIMGIVNSAKGEMKPLPVIGNIELIKFE